MGEEKIIYVQIHYRVNENDEEFGTANEKCIHIARVNLGIHQSLGEINNNNCSSHWLHSDLVKWILTL